MGKIKTVFEIEGIGPHETKLVLDDELQSNAVAIFARNGSGKSFIGRVFRQVARVGWKVLRERSSGTEILQKNEGYTLLSIGQRSGRMRLSQQCENKEPKAFSVDVSIAADGSEKIVLQGKPDYIYRVFNQQYVEENIKEHAFVLSGRTNQGWVIGETNILIDKLQSELRELTAREEEMRKGFANAGRDCAARLTSQYKVSKNTGVFKQLFAESSFSIAADVDEVGVREFAVVAEKLSTLVSIPDDLADIAYLNECVYPHALIDEVSEFLRIVVPRSMIVGAGADEIKNNRDFFEQGLQLSVRDALHCPFCHQDMTETAIKLLEQYRTFLSGAEVKAAKTAAYLKDQIKDYFSKVDLLRKSLREQRSCILTVGRYFDSVEPIVKDIPEQPPPNDSAMRQLIEEIEQKVLDPSQSITLSSELKDSIKSEIDGVERIRKEYDRCAHIINVKKLSTTKDRLLLRVELVKAAFVELKKTQRLEIARWTKLKSEITEKRGTLDNLLASNRESQRKLVFDTASALIRELFGDKYALREEDFVLQFRGIADPNRPISTILSDGEKSAISLCYFFAETHLLLERKSEYKKLFFILDDPVSSMDAQFVYAICNLVKRIDRVFPQMDNEPKRYWIFTHSMNFYAMLMRNNVCKEGFVLYDGAFKRIPEQMLLPFEAHLADVVRVADNIDNPKHTTGNSIRHVLEVLSKFEYPLKTIEQFVSEDEYLSQNPSVLPFANDFSHGAFQNNQVSIDPIIISVCNTVTQYVNSRYPGQIEAIRKKYEADPIT